MRKWVVEAGAVEEWVKGLGRLGEGVRGKGMEDPRVGLEGDWEGEEERTARCLLRVLVEVEAGVGLQAGVATTHPIHRLRIMHNLLHFLLIHSVTRTHHHHHSLVLRTLITTHTTHPYPLSHIRLVSPISIQHP